MGMMCSIQGLLKRSLVRAEDVLRAPLIFVGCKNQISTLLSENCNNLVFILVIPRPCLRVILKMVSARKLRFTV